MDHVTSEGLSTANTSCATLCSDDDLDFMDCDMPSPPGSETSSLNHIKFEVLTPDEIVTEMVDKINEVNAVVNLPPTLTRVLLNFFKWDKETLLEKYFEGNREEFFHQVHIQPPRCRKKLLLSPTKSETGAEICEICFNEVSCNMMTSIECGHKFCTACWVTYLGTKIMSEGGTECISCPGDKCDSLIDDAIVMELVSDMKIKRRYKQLIISEFVSTNKLMVRCPTPDCMSIIKVKSSGMQPVTCSCGRIFCFECGYFWHDPVHCRLLRKWLAKCEEDSDTSNWIAANTKQCPRCNATIEKDGGCNHMICKNKNCKYDFCWVCLGPWDPHGSAWYTCNRYEDEESKAARNDQEKKRASLSKFLHYYNRYKNHEQSQKFENVLHRSIKNKMEDMQQFNMTWAEAQFLQKAVDILCLCRQTLMCTYVFGYYLVRNNQSIIFLDNQGDLESSVEMLSEYLERDITNANIADIKQRVQDKCKYCERRRRVLLDHVHEGNDMDWWNYTE